MMKITVNNFKAITSPFTIDLKGINIIAGQNSGGKSSLIHSLLFLKQNIENINDNEYLKFNEPYLSLGKFSDIASNNKNDGKIDFIFEVDLNQNQSTKNKNQNQNHSKNEQNITCHIRLCNARQNYRVYKQYIDFVKISLNKNEELCINRTKGNNYIVSCTPEFTKHIISPLYRQKSKPLPTSFKTKINAGNLSLNLLILEHKGDYFRSYLIDKMSREIRQAFKKLYYIGPLRESPRNYYFFEDNISSQVGIRGEFTPQHLASNSDKECTYFKVMGDGSIAESETHETLFEATKYWVCEHFKLGKNLTFDNDKSGVLHRITLESNVSTHKSSINNVGFGVSQILPIIVQCMSMDKGGIIILEQPEIHLHPTAQAKLFDFINAINKSSKSVIVETHSDHLVTRLRRRVAESTGNLAEQIKLTFVENDEPTQSSIYKTLLIDELGNFDSWPKGFFDQYDTEIRSILLAQIHKKKNNNN